jgi:uncharacterized membrane protein
MRGPIDYIVVGFEGNDFKGEVLEALSDAQEKGVIDVLDLAIIIKDENGDVASIEVADVSDELVQAIATLKGTDEGLITDEDVEEIGEILEPNTAAGLLIIEQLWAKPLKKAIVDANGVLIADGRIHPEAAEELEDLAQTVKEIEQSE